MGTRLVHQILAVVTTTDTVVGGGTPIFHVTDAGERERVANLLARILQAMVHDIGNGTYILVKH
ncbi:MAG: hypothetical protein AB1445_00285 [Bacillota bacterium]